MPRAGGQLPHHPHQNAAAVSLATLGHLLSCQRCPCAFLLTSAQKSSFPFFTEQTHLRHQLRRHLHEVSQHARAWSDACLVCERHSPCMLLPPRLAPREASQLVRNTPQRVAHFCLTRTKPGNFGSKFNALCTILHCCSFLDKTIFSLNSR